MAYNPYQPAEPLKDPGIALILTIVGFFFIAGLQYFYIGKYLKGILFLLTLGFLYIGTIISLFTIRGETIRKNRRAMR
ncbi:TM2 domain-containing protein [Brevibacterium sp. 50QC2O2]|jgi:TM2 domain-containing membrane protein YozV|uniref:TM2 domain-containing protein n=1 Tax=Brevibacterium TaxID=1696 RepID=UPI00211C7CBC|nr:MULTISPECIES: TM2 domain-containing protein [unclassified Brevibacterium]MCQ9369133.1 TM2 domain-containing protein [Brevibacterium sp. 91QC2O2]MCQ9386490.1 TM2 domain-containing protein [Brevibacterium sp. 68QC2CO]MCQ9387046.1 TM2 domain-containing protein [Brevibacterium sp. 50QC2O2]